MNIYPSWDTLKSLESWCVCKIGFPPLDIVIWMKTCMFAAEQLLDLRKLYVGQKYSCKNIHDTICC